MSFPWNVIAHRGRWAGETDGLPGNTLAAFDKLLAAHPNIGVETDVRLTKDGLLIVAHDNRLENFTNRTGFANELKRKDLDTLRIKLAGQLTDHKIPELEEVLQLFNERGFLHLELKYGPDDPNGLLEKVLAIIKKYPDQKIAISSFNHCALAEVPAHIPIGILTNAMPMPSISTYAKNFTANGQRSFEHISFHPDIWNLTSDAMKDAKNAGIKINAYTIPQSMFEWTYKHGVNPITDYPIDALDFLKQTTKI